MKSALLFVLVLFNNEYIVHSSVAVKSSINECEGIGKSIIDGFQKMDPRIKGQYMCK